MPGRPQISPRGAVAPTSLGRRLRVGKAILALAVEVCVPRISERRGGADDGVEKPIVLDPSRDVQRTAASSESVGAAFEVLEPLEIGKDVLEAPATTPHLRPCVVIERVASYENASIDRGRPSKDAPARH